MERVAVAALVAPAGDERIVGGVKRPRPRIAGVVRGNEVERSGVGRVKPGKRMGRRLRIGAAVERVRADLGMDIGGVMIGMQLREVAVPVPLEHNTVGEARIIAARTRPKYVGGERAVYDEEKK